MRNIFKYIPMVTFGQIIGGVLVVPLIYFLINKLYFPYKYNDNVEVYAEEYIKKSRRIKVYMNDYDSKMYLSNLEPETKTLETFMVKMDGNYFILLSDKNKQKALYLFIHRCCSRFTYPWAWFSVLNCKHYKMCLF